MRRCLGRDYLNVFLLLISFTYICALISFRVPSAILAMSGANTRSTCSRTRSATLLACGTPVSLMDPPPIMATAATLWAVSRTRRCLILLMAAHTTTHHTRFASTIKTNKNKPIYEASIISTHINNKLLVGGPRLDARSTQPHAASDWTHEPSGAHCAAELGRQRWPAADHWPWRRWHLQQLLPRPAISLYQLPCG